MTGACRRQRGITVCNYMSFEITSSNSQVNKLHLKIFLKRAKEIENSQHFNVKTSQVQWFQSIIPATLEAKAGGS